MQIATAIALAFLVGSTTGVLAQTGHNDHSAMMNHSAHMQGGITASDMALTEPGQGAFAALSEMVKVLEGDPDTDWSKVDLTDLRNHLVDMDRVVTDTIVTETDLPDGISALVTRDADTIEALRRMVPAHASELAKDDRWTVRVEDNGDVLLLIVRSADPGVVARIKGLGFFGLMASQDHHREHHMMIARGESPHSH